MLVFLDTEYSGFSHPSIERKLISLALVTEDGKKEWYGELDGWTVNDCSPWVQQHVLPLITGHKITRQVATASLVEWFGSLPRKVQVACDSETDWQFLKALLDVLPANLARDRYDLAQLITNSIYHHTVIGYFQKGNPEHHSLHDARAYRLGWLAWMAQKNLNTRD